MPQARHVRLARLEKSGLKSLLWIFGQFLKIALLTGKPYEVPGDQATLRLAITFAFLTHVIAVWGLYQPAAAIGQAILELVLSGSALYIGLSVFAKSERFVQAYASLCGAGAIVNIAFIPVIYSSISKLRASVQAGVEPEPSALVSFLTFFFLVWTISIIARVVRFSFDTNIPVSILVSFSYIMVARAVYNFVFP